MNIDVIIPLFNKKHEIIRALDSVLFQTYKLNKVIIVDNNSTDGSYEIVRDYIKNKGKTLFVLVREYKQGPSNARNFGVRISKAKYVAFLDADDFWSKFHLEKAVEVINNESLIDVYSSSYVIFSKSNFNIPRNVTGDKIYTKNMYEFSKQYFLNRSMICSSSIVIKRDILVSSPFKDIKIGEDIDYWFNVVSKFKFINNNHVTAFVDRQPISKNSMISMHPKVIDDAISSLAKFNSAYSIYRRLFYLRRGLIILISTGSLHRLMLRNIGVILCFTPLIVVVEIYRYLLSRFRHKSSMDHNNILFNEYFFNKYLQ